MLLEILGSVPLHFGVRLQSSLCSVCILLLTIHLIMVRFFMKIIAPRPHLLLLHGLRTHDGYIPNSLLPKFKSQTELFECLLRQKLQKTDVKEQHQNFVNSCQISVADLYSFVHKLKTNFRYRLSADCRATRIVFLIFAVIRT